MTARAAKVRLPEIGTLARGRLWLSYQRYAFLLIGLPSALVIAAALALPWWAALVVGICALAPVRFGVEVWSRWPRKLRATRVAMARIEAGSFHHASIKRHCGDPCFRVVADEILARANLPRSERKHVITMYAGQLRKEDSMLVLVDHVRGTVITFGGETQEGP